MKELIEFLARGLVDNQDEVRIEEEDNGDRWSTTSRSPRATWAR
jgi:predicted RNA-binding protein YlqC (UPF0109 family)